MSDKSKETKLRAEEGAGTAESSAMKDKTDAELIRASRVHTRRSFAVAAAAAAAGYGFYQWIGRSYPDQRQPVPLRRALLANAALSQAVFQERALAPTYPLAKAENLRVNGIAGLKQELVPESWRLQLVGVESPAKYPQYVPDVTAWEYKFAATENHEDQGHDTKVRPKSKDAPRDTEQSTASTQKQDAVQPLKKQPRGREEAGESRSGLASATPGLLLELRDILALPSQELVTQFKCIEGWSQIVHWTGVRMADLIARYPPARKPDGSLPRYVYMETPDGDYYVGYDLNVCQHPQTLLVTAMGGQPLTQFHGAPLRLHTPTKYGYKQIKRIGLIAYTDSRPDDYWTKLGYDWYAGL